MQRLERSRPCFGCSWKEQFPERRSRSLRNSATTCARFAPSPTRPVSFKFMPRRSAPSIPRLAPLLPVLQVTAPMDADLAALWKEISERRAANMQTLAENLLATGQVRDGLPARQLADIIWSIGSPQFFLLLVGERGWSIETFERWLGEAWIALLLRDASTEKNR